MDTCRQLLPTVVFCFSKKRVDALADNLSRLDLATASEKAEAHIFCERALGRLRGTDRQLPQIRRLREMLARGLGVHHAGVEFPSLSSHAPIVQPFVPS